MTPKILLSIGKFDPVNYEAAIRAAGGEPFAAYLPAPDLSFDGLILAGGDDADPTLFGQENQGSRGIDLVRDKAELVLLNAFLGAGKPVLAICRGCQMVNIWAGGDLIQDLGPRVPCHQQAEGDLAHPVRAGEGTLLHRLYGPEFDVNSNHHQAIGRLGRGLWAAAYSADGVVEALEHNTLPLIAVQFHPERMTGARARPDTVDGGAVFRAFLAMCG